MDKIPFSIYDFISYLFPGCLILISVDFALGSHWIIHRSMEIGDVGFWLITSYIVGHVNAHWAGWLLENKVIRNLGYPSVNLFTDISSRMFKHYRQKLPAGTATRVKEKYKRMIADDIEGEDMFLFCYHLVKEECPQAMARLYTFLGLYGFCRNLSFAIGMIVVILSFAAITRKRPDYTPIVIASVVISLTLFYRYLKFYRHYSVELFLSFLTSVKEKADSK